MARVKRRDGKRLRTQSGKVAVTCGGGCSLCTVEPDGAHDQHIFTTLTGGAAPNNCLGGSLGIAAGSLILQGALANCTRDGHSGCCQRLFLGQGSSTCALLPPEAQGVALDIYAEYFFWVEVLPGLDRLHRIFTIALYHNGAPVGYYFYSEDLSFISSQDPCQWFGELFFNSYTSAGQCCTNVGGRIVLGYSGAYRHESPV